MVLHVLVLAWKWSVGGKVVHETETKDIVAPEWPGCSRGHPDHISCEHVKDL